jgi:hypothetical protein
MRHKRSPTENHICFGAKAGRLAARRNARGLAIGLCGASWEKLSRLIENFA